MKRIKKTGGNQKLISRVRRRGLAIVIMFSLVIAMMMPASNMNLSAAAKPKLSKRSVSLKVGKKATVKLRNFGKKDKVKWSSSKPSVAKIVKSVKKGKKASVTIKGRKKGNTKVTAKFKWKGKKKKLVLKVKVTEVKKSSQNSSKTSALPIGSGVPNASVSPSMGVPVVTASSVPDEGVSPTPENEKKITIADTFSQANIFIDASGDDYDGVSLVAEAFAGDVELVCGKKPSVVTDSSKLGKTAIIAGTIGKNQVIDDLISAGKLDVSKIKDKWETYIIKIVDNPCQGVEQAIVVVGSDKRGTEYGIFHISELMGVSPWVYWGDAVPDTKEQISFVQSELECTSKEPSVKYRGIFLNDEAPSLTSWTKNKFGGYNEDFYDHVFELLLRLKANYLWPAMWSNCFSTDGKSSSIANAAHADAYGIVMGASHHEPMCRAGVEWGRVWKNYVDSSLWGKGSAALWDYTQIPESLNQFWEDGIKRNKDFENIVTVGMRGENDSSLGLSATEYAKLLKDIITNQKDILEKNDMGDTPTLLAVYKEVESAWYEGGLQDWTEGLKDTTIMLCDDNFANFRTLPTEEYRDSYGGWGMYYHFDYVGGPRSYTWLNTVQIDKVYDQMSMAYDYGVDDVWIVNVGDLKPMELGISYFIDMAYDMDTWGKEGLCRDYEKQWIEKQFGSALTEEQTADVASIMKGYLDLGTSRKAEIITSSTYSLINFSEAQDWLIQCNTLMEKAEKYYQLMPEDLKAAYYELIYYPTMSVANVNKMQIFAGLNEMYYKQNRASANVYAKLLKDTIALDKELLRVYNEELPVVGDKWNGMMSYGLTNPHVGMTGWQPESGEYPIPQYVTVPTEAKMLVSAEGESKTYTTGSCSLPQFTSTNKEAYTLEIANGGGTPFEYKASANADWIQLSETSGSVTTQKMIEVSIDWEKVTKNSTGKITVTGANGTVIVNVSAKVTDVSKLEKGTYVVENGYASINAGNYTKKAEGASGEYFFVFDGYGKTGKTIKVLPTTKTFDADKLSDAPYVEYKVYVEEAGTYNLMGYFNPTSNADKESVQLRYAVSVDGGSATVKNTLPSGYIGGSSSTWGDDVRNNARTASTEHTLSAGIHTIRYYQIDPNTELLKMVLYTGSLASSYNGPSESYYVGKNVDTASRIADKKALYALFDGISVFPGCISETISAEKSFDAVVTAGGKYTFTLQASGIGSVDLYWKNTKVKTFTIDGSNTYDSTERVTMTQGAGVLRVVPSSGVKVTNLKCMNTLAEVIGKNIELETASASSDLTGAYNESTYCFEVSKDEGAGNGYGFTMPITVGQNATVKVNLIGTYKGTQGGFRVWLGSNGNAGTNVETVNTFNADGTFDAVVYLTGTGARDLNELRIKAISNSAYIDNLVIRGIGVSEIDVYDQDLDLSKVEIGDSSVNKGAYDSTSKALVVSGDSGSGAGYFFALPATVPVGTSIEVQVEGSYTGTEGGFRMWLGTGANAHGDIKSISASSTFNETFTLAPTDMSCNRLTIKSNAGSKLTGLTVTKIHVKYYLDK